MIDIFPGSADDVANDVDRTVKLFRDGRHRLTLEQNGLKNPGVAMGLRMRFDITGKFNKSRPEVLTKDVFFFKGPGDCTETLAVAQLLAGRRVAKRVSQEGEKEVAVEESTGTIADDTNDPGGESRVTAKAGKVSHDQQHDILGDVVPIVAGKMPGLD